MSELHETLTSPTEIVARVIEEYGATMQETLGLTPEEMSVIVLFGETCVVSGQKDALEATMGLINGLE